MTNDVFTAGPAAVRRLDTPGAQELADLAAIFEDLQTVLRCCERLMSELAPGERARGEGARGERDDLTLEVLWTTAVLSYARCFTGRATGTGLTMDDITATGLGGDLLGWHRILQRLRDHYGDPAVNPREVFSVGASQDDAGRASGLAVTSARQPPVDELTVRQTGAIAFELTRIVDRRIGERQQALFGTLGAMTRAELDRLPLVEVAADSEPGRGPST